MPPGCGSRLSPLPATVPCPWRGTPALTALRFNQNHQIPGPLLPQQTCSVCLSSEALQISEISPKSRQANRGGRQAAITRCYQAGGTRALPPPPAARGICAKLPAPGLGFFYPWLLLR